MAGETLSRSFFRSTQAKCRLTPCGCPARDGSKMQSFRSVFHAAIAIVLCGAFVLGLDLLENVAGRAFAIGFLAFLVVISVVGLILIWASWARRR